MSLEEFGPTWDVLKGKYLPHGRPHTPVDVHQKDSPPATPTDATAAGADDVVNKEEGIPDWNPSADEEKKAFDKDDYEDDDDFDDNEEEEEGHDDLSATDEQAAKELKDKMNAADRDEDPDEKEDIEPDDAVEEKQPDANMPEYPDDTKLLIQAADEARKAFEEKEKEVNDADKQKTQLEETINKVPCEIIF